MPLLSLSYKYFLLRHSFSTLSFNILKPIFLAAASFEKPKNSSENLSQQFVDLLPVREEMAVNFIVPEVNFLPISLSLAVFLSSANLFS